MSADPSTKSPDASPGKGVENKSAENKPAVNKPGVNEFDRFHPDMPQIPGVSQGPRHAPRASSDVNTQRLLQIGGIAAVVLIGAVVFLWVRGRSHRAVNSSFDPDVAQPVAPAQPSPVAALQEGPTVAATADELSKPWSARKFEFVKPASQENIDAVVIRLPGGELWAFSLQVPLGRCELEYVTDLGRLASEFKYNAGHPMVVSPCDGTVYDPLKVGPLEGNTWARGEIVRGGGLRPPISIEVKVSGHSIIADSIEQ
jgi:hypothetical protein